MKKKKANTLKKVLIALAVAAFIGASSVTLTACTQNNQTQKTSENVDI